jgi:hypothetical protein
MHGRIILNARWENGRIVGDLVPCNAQPRHNTVELLNGECLLCAQQREWDRVLAAGEYQMRPYWEWDTEPTQPPPPGSPA